MSLVSPVPAVLRHQQTPPGTVRSESVQSLSSSSLSSSSARSVGLTEIEEKSPRGPLSMVVDDEEDMVYVAVGKDVKESKPILESALKGYEQRKIGILHVHQPDQWIPMGLGGRFRVENLSKSQLKVHRQEEKERVQKILDQYLIICAKKGVKAEKFTIDRDEVGKGIVELIAQLGIKKLVMGSQYSKKMRAPRSKTAVFVQHEAPPICSISFICPGNITCTREATPELITQSPETQLKQLPWSRSMPLGDSMSLLNPTPDSLRKCQSTNAVSPPSRLTGATMTPRSTLTTGEDVDIWESIQKMRTSEAGEPSSSSWTNDLGKFSMPRDEDGCSLQSVRESEEGFHESHQVHMEFACNGEGSAKYQLQQTMEEVNKAKQEAYEEYLRRQKAEMAAFEAHLQAKRTEKSYNEEKKQRIESEEALRMTTIEVQSLKSRRDEVLEELHKANDWRLMFEVQIADSKQTVKELEEKLQSAQDLIVNLQREREELQRECDEAIMEAKTTRKAETSSSQCAQNFSEFTYIEIMEATNNFSDSLKIGEGGYGSVYKGFLHHTPVAIKMLHLDSLQGCDEFYQEVNVLSRVRHPNLVTLIGACPEAWALVYEFLPNGSLEDRLQRSDGTPPLTWQARTRIAAEVCAALIFLHSNRPNMVIHGDLKPGNILLDANLVSKLGDFGICRLLHNPSSSNPPTSTLCHHTDPKGTFAYMDPEFSSTGELTHRSDVYSFGVILLRLLTARPVLAIQKVVQDALDNGTLNTVLDASAGKWPFVQAKQLAHIGLRCCEMNRKRRPDLVSDVWRVLEPMKVSAGTPSSFRLAVDEHGCIPPYFMCPIFQEIMKDPHVAADGYTYEAEALKGWLESGHDTSPMTNVKLSHHQLIPNHALRSAIQEWMQQQRSLC